MFDAHSSYERYLEDVSRHPRITPEREAELSDIILNSGDEAKADAAMQEMVEANLRLVVHCLKEFGRFVSSPAVQITEMDLIAEGNIALMHASRRFNAAFTSDNERRSSVRFSTYACKCIKSRMRRALKLARFIHIPEHHFSYWSEMEKLREEYGDALTDELIHDKLDVSNEVVHLLKQSEKSRTFALEDMVAEDSDGDWSDFIPNEAAPIPSREAGRHDLRSVLMSEMEKLPERTRGMLGQMFFDDGSPTLREMSTHYGVSSERCRQVCAQGLSALRRQMEPRLELIDPRLGASRMQMAASA
jgi:RNA polymerase sigma-32 factor